MTALSAAPPAELAYADAYCLRLARRHYENFTVASAVLPAELRVHLARLYAYCRVTDDLGDESRDESRLRAWREDVVSALAADGTLPTHPVLLAVRETVAACGLPLSPFLDLVEANLLDQQVVRYQTWEDLLAYCRLSAAPVGRMVLGVFGLRSARAGELSDQVCIGLQLANFAQDVGVDAGLGRRYLPGDDVDTLGTRGAVATMCARAQEMLDAGRELEAMTGGRLRAQLALYRLGGSAILEAIRAAGYRTDTMRPRVSGVTKAALAAEAVAMVLGGTDGGGRARGDIIEAERHCQRLARRNAANFYWGFIALPRAQRTAIYSLYDFARQVDDAVDIPGDDDPRDRLAAERARLDNALAGRPDDEVTAVLARAVAVYRIPRSELDELIDGVECDLTVNHYASWDELSAYCRLVASTVGRMCVRIFGFDDAVALEHADDLGMAMQLTNILRDVRGDRELGRVYLPTDELAAFGIDEAQLSAALPPPRWHQFIAFQAERARGLFSSGLRVERHIPWRAAVCVRTMAGLYERILTEIEQQPLLPLERRLSLTPSRKAGVLLRASLPRTGARLAEPAGR